MSDLYVIVIPASPPAPMEVVGPFGSLDKAERWAVGLKLISWTACPILHPDEGRVVIEAAGRWTRP